MIYFIRATESNRIKIGKANDVESRFRTLRTASPEPLELLGSIPGDLTQEAILHRRFSRWRANGEWFHGNSELLEAIHQMTALPLHGEISAYRVWRIDGEAGNDSGGGVQTLLVIDFHVTYLGDGGAWSIRGLSPNLYKMLLIADWKCDWQRITAVQDVTLSDPLCICGFEYLRRVAESYMALRETTEDVCPLVADTGRSPVEFLEVSKATLSENKTKRERWLKHREHEDYLREVWNSCPGE